MIKAKKTNNGACAVSFEGDGADIIAEFGALISHIYKRAIERDPGIAIGFKDCIQDLVKNDSWVWRE